MKPMNPERTDRTHAVRTQINQKGMQGLLIEQGRRQAETGKRARLADIEADWIEEKAESIIQAQPKE